MVTFRDDVEFYLRIRLSRERVSSQAIERIVADWDAIHRRMVAEGHDTIKTAIPRLVEMGRQ